MRREIGEKKYGFVRYNKVDDERVLEIKLNNIWLDGGKINANISKFKRKVNNNQRVKERTRKLGREAVEGGRKEGNDTLASSGPSNRNRFKTFPRSFAEAVNGNEVRGRVGEEEACKSLFFKTTTEEAKKF